MLQMKHCGLAIPHTQIHTSKTVMGKLTASELRLYIFFNRQLLDISRSSSVEMLFFTSVKVLKLHFSIRSL